MIIARAAAITLLVVAPALPAATPLDTRHARETITVDYLLESCTVVGETAHGLVPHFDCESWLYGVLATLEAMHEPTVCPPAPLAPWQAYDVLIAAPVPEGRGGEPALPYVLERLRAAFPCG